MGKSMDRGGKKRNSKGGDSKKNSRGSSSKESRKSSRGSDKKDPRKKSKARKSDVANVNVNLNQLVTETSSKPKIIEKPKCKFFGPCNLEARQAHTAILLLRSEEDRIVLQALNDLQKFCKQREENKQIIVDCNGVEALIELVSSPNQVMQRLALKILSLTSHIRKSKLILRDYEMFPKLVGLVKSKDDVVVEYSTGILANCATLYATRMDILENNGAVLLSELITRADPDIQKNSLEAIWRLLENRDCLPLFTVKKHLDAIMKHVDSEYPAIQVVGLAIAERISATPSELLKLEPYHIVKNYAAKLASMETADLHRVCLRALVNMADIPVYAERMFKYLLAFAELMENTKDIKVLISIVTLFGKLCSVSSTNQHLVDIGVTQKLISILKLHANLELREATVYTVGLLAGDYRAKEILVAAIEPIITFSEIRRNSTQACEYSFKALSSILEGGHESGPAFLDYDGLRLILKIFVNPSKYTEITCVYAMHCAYAVSKVTDQRRFLVENGLVAGILMVMGTRNLKLVTQACLALCGLMTDEVGRIQFIEKDGYLRILRTLSCPETVVPLAFVPLISVLSKYPDLAHILIVKGVLKAMSIRIDLITESALFRAALDRLLKFHLPAKYAITGHIDYFEKLEDGFYDQGYLKKDEPFVHIQEMIYETRNPTKRVIYLNLTHKFDHVVIQQNPILEHVRHNKETVVNCYALLVQEILAQDQRIGNGQKPDEKFLIGIFATVIANKMGGQVDKFQLSSQSEDIELANLQSLYKSTVVPVTMIKNGVFAPRALIFKALADIFEIPCSLDRGGYNKCWNTVMLGSKDKHKPCLCAERKGNEHNMVFTEKLDRYVVDLVYKPGSLFPLYSYEAKTYCFK